MAIGLVLIIAATYWQVPQLGFTNWDDQLHITENERFQPVSAQNVLYFWWHPGASKSGRAPKVYEQLYQPITFTVWALIALISLRPTALPIVGGNPSRLDPHLFHAANLIVHILCALLVFAILRLLLRRLEQTRLKVEQARLKVEQTSAFGSGAIDGAAFCGALFWALHPVQVEAVAWVTGFNNVLSGFFALLGLWIHLENSAAPAERAGRGRREGLALLCFALALCSKPTAATLPCIAWLLDVLILERPAGKAALALAGWGLLSLICVLMNHAVQPVNPAIVTPLWSRPFITADALCFYLKQLIWPLRLAVDYGRTPGVVLGLLWNQPWWLIPFVLVGLAWWRRRAWPVAAAGVAIFFLYPLPTSGPVPYYFHGYSTVADRYLYLGLLGPALILAWGLTRRPSPVAYGIAAICLLLYGFTDTIQVATWDNSFSLWQHTIDVNPHSWVGYSNLGMAMIRSDDPNSGAALGRRAVLLNPQYAVAHYTVGLGLARQGDLSHARDEFGAAIALSPDYLGAYVNLAAVCLLEGRYEEAASSARHALQLDPNRGEAYQYLGIALAQLGDLSGAVEALRKKVALQPEDSDGYAKLSMVLRMTGQDEPAIEAAAHAVQLNPAYPPAHFALVQALTKAGRLGEAHAEWLAIQRLEPGNQAAAEALRERPADNSASKVH